MKLTRQQLRQLILETTIKPMIPGLDPKSFGKAQDLARSPDEYTRSQADHLASGVGYDGSFSQDMADYDIAGRITTETVSTMGPDGRVEVDVDIPYNLVDDVIDAHQRCVAGGYPSSEKDSRDFNKAAHRIFNHVDSQVPDVYEYGVGTRGYRAQEYDDAMMASGDYI